MSALLQAPDSDLKPDGEASDQMLVAAVRRGDDRAFEALYERFHRRIHAYVFGMVKDHQRAEDVTQEVFVSALRRMRATERPIAFKPWVYEIAKNACIDQFRRSKRAEEVSYDADDGLAPSDYGRLVSHEPVPDAALHAKQQLEQLCGAFGGLSDAHHEILVLRELEGLSYREIGERMGMSRPAVESTLFRARRRLTEEYDELASGQRCLRIQSIIAGAGSGRLGARDTRRLARHVAHCQPCRREAVAAGVVDAALIARRPVRRRIAEKVAALFPFPLLLRGRKGPDASPTEGWINQLPAVSDHAAAGTAKLAAAAVVLVAGLTAGVETHVGTVDASRERAADRAVQAAAQRVASERSGATRSIGATPAGTSRERGDGTGRLRGDTRPGATRRRLGTGAPKGVGSVPRTQAAGGQALSGGLVGGAGAGGSGGAVPGAVRDQTGDSTPGTGTDPAPRIDVQVPAVQLPATNQPESSPEPGQVVDGVIQTVDQTAGAVQNAAEDPVQAVTGAGQAGTEQLPVQP